MEVIRIITNKDELEGTCYIEILPGPYANQCWNEGSLFFDEEVFKYIEPIIELYVAKYDHYAFTEIERDQCYLIAADLCLLAEKANNAASVFELKNQIGFLFKYACEQFFSDFEANKYALAKLAIHLSNWIKTKVDEHGCVTILGI
jgi:hypothetical protein